MWLVRTQFSHSRGSFVLKTGMSMQKCYSSTTIADRTVMRQTSLSFGVGVSSFQCDRLVPPQASTQVIGKWQNPTREICIVWKTKGSQELKKRSRWPQAIQDCALPRFLKIVNKVGKLFSVRIPTYVASAFAISPAWGIVNVLNLQPLQRDVNRNVP